MGDTTKANAAEFYGNTNGYDTRYPLGHCKSIITDAFKIDTNTSNS